MNDLSTNEHSGDDRAKEISVAKSVLCLYTTD